ncbi:MAG: HlyD family efflux transporter periplasmic adaptor subunit, partial [Actinomycetota bacterium]|nr:HlyD family efflux transporter periplasmic adaptor subunit [Actinomycetota bacterium]
TASQRTVAAAQQRQAAVALEAAQAKDAALTVVAPIGGVVEFGAAATGGGIADDAADLPADVAGLLGGTRGGTGGPVAVGAPVGVGQTLFTVYDLSGFHLRAAVDEVDAVQLERGQPVRVFLDAYPDDVLAGSVTRVAVGPGQGITAGVVYPVAVALDDLPSDVRPRVGMTASVEIEVRRVRSATVVPASALVRRDGRDVVLVVRDADGARRVRAVPVELRAVSDDLAAVDGDVAAGERVVVAGFEQVEDGDRLP